MQKSFFFVLQHTNIFKDLIDLITLQNELDQFKPSVGIGITSTIVQREL